jgi:hypothetical protein
LIAFWALVGLLVGVNAKAAVLRHECSAALGMVRFVENVEIADLCFKSQDQFPASDPIEGFLRHSVTNEMESGFQSLSRAQNHNDLERYHLGMVTYETELAPFEEHLLGCPECADRAAAAADYVDLMRQAIIKGDWDLE